MHIHTSHLCTLSYVYFISLSLSLSLSFSLVRSISDFFSPLRLSFASCLCLYLSRSLPFFPNLFQWPIFVIRIFRLFNVHIFLLFYPGFTRLDLLSNNLRPSVCFHVQMLTFYFCVCVCVFVCVCARELKTNLPPLRVVVDTGSKPSKPVFLRRYFEPSF